MNWIEFRIFKDYIKDLQMHGI